MIGREVVEVARVRFAPVGPDVLVPAPTDDPFARRLLRHGRLHPVPAAGDGSEVAQVHPLQVQTEAHEVQMRVHDSGAVLLGGLDGELPLSAYLDHVAGNKGE